MQRKTVTIGYGQLRIKTRTCATTRPCVKDLNGVVLVFQQVRYARRSLSAAKGHSPTTHWFERPSSLAHLFCREVDGERHQIVVLFPKLLWLLIKVRRRPASIIVSFCVCIRRHTRLPSIILCPNPPVSHIEYTPLTTLVAAKKMVYTYRGPG